MDRLCLNFDAAAFWYSKEVKHVLTLSYITPI